VAAARAQHNQRRPGNGGGACVALPGAREWSDPIVVCNELWTYWWTTLLAVRVSTRHVCVRFCWSAESAVLWRHNGRCVRCGACAVVAVLWRARGVECIPLAVIQSHATARIIPSFAVVW